jgi:hypothetical protein
MKFVTIVALLFALSAFANEEEKKEGHAKTHEHVTKDADHKHEDGHHKDAAKAEHAEGKMHAKGHKKK